MNRRLGKFTAPAALILATALTLSACGDKDDTSAGDDKPASSAATSSSPKEAMTKETFFPTLIAAQQKAGTSHMTMNIGAAGQTITAEGDVKTGKSLNDTAMSLTMDMGAAGLGDLKMVIIDGAFYMNLGSMTQGKYAKIDLSDQNNAFGKQFTQLADQMDPSKQLAQFQTAVTSFAKKGSPEKIDGVDAQPYELVLDTSKIEAFKNLPAEASSSVPETLTYLMYLGPDDLPRRMVFEVAGSKSQIDYSKWGEDVDIKAPSASEVSDQDLSKLMGGAATPSA